jgi:hypothetical protein
MILLLNLIFAILAFFFTRYVMLECKATPVVATVVGVLMGIVVFLANLGAQVV